MGLPRQSRKNQVALQPRKVRLRLVQLAPCMIPAAEVLAGATTLTLTFMPPGIGPQQLWVLDTGGSAEVVSILSVNPATSQITLTTATTKAHKPGKEWVPLMPVGTSQEKVFGKWFFASWAGLNGNRGQGGWLQGEYLRQMIEEGTGQISVPNAAGSDGVKHYDRFLITTLENYRVGDEWIEIWSMSTSHAAGDLLFVGSPNEAKVSETEITLGLVDGYYLLKKQRESNAGFWNNGPRDVFEEYTKQMQVFMSDGFDEPTNYPAAPATAGESGDKRWKMSNVIASPVSSNVRLTPLGSGTQSYLRFATPLKIGTTEEGGHPWEHSDAAHEQKQMRFRFEVGFTVPSGGAPNMAIELVPSAWPGGSGGTLFMNLTPTEGLLYSYQGSAHAATQAIQKTAQNAPFFGPGQHTAAIEGRGRWVFFYLDGVLLGILPCTFPAQELYPQIAFFGTSSAATAIGAWGANYMDVDYMLLRQAVPMLMRSTTDKGDYRLPGSPSGSGLKGEYFSDTDIASDFNQGHKALAPLRQPFATRVDGSLNGSPGLKWWPEGVVEEGNFSVRWTGSIYLDLSNFDYLLQIQCYAGARVWIGKTRWDEQILDCWPTNNKGSEWLIFEEDQIPHLKGTALSPGPLYGQQSGWFPIMVEYIMGNPKDLEGTTPYVVLFYERSDLAMTVPINTGPYPHLIAVDGPWWYFPLDHSGYNGANFFFDSAEIGQFSLLSGNSKVPQYQAGPVANDSAFSVPGETTTVLQYAHVGEGGMSTAGWTSETVEVWCNPTVAASGFQQVVINSPFVFQISLSTAGKPEWFVGNGASWGLSKTATEAIPSGAWTHLSMTYDGTTMRCYVNGVLVASAGPLASQFGSNATQAGIGYWPGGGAGAHEKSQFQGGIAQFAVYKNKVLTAERLLAHTEAANASALLNGGTVQAQSMVPCSPQGFFAQQVRSESHYELLRSFAEEWGLQWTARPMSLESGEFPARMCPRIEEGRQTDYVIDHSNVVGPQVTILADDTADTLLVDAQGLADSTGAGQLQAEVFNFFEIAAHALTNTEYDSPGDIQVLQQLVTRADSLLALRAAPWTELEAQARGKRSLTDTWPLSGILAEFPWLPGEGVRCLLPGIGVEDTSTRQLWGMKWPIYPDGIGAPSPVFKQRPRSVKEAIRHVITALRSKTRNYQGQFAIQDGALGGITYNNGTLTALGSSVDQYTRITLPPNLSKIKAAYVSVQTISRSASPAMTWTLEINGVSTGIVVTTAGAINVMAYVNRNAETTQRMYARLVGTGTGNGTYEIKLETQLII